MREVRAIECLIGGLTPNVASNGAAARVLLSRLHQKIAQGLHSTPLNTVSAFAAVDFSPRAELCPLPVRIGPHPPIVALSAADREA